MELDRYRPVARGSIDRPKLDPQPRANSCHRHGHPRSFSAGDPTISVGSPPGLSRSDRLLCASWIPTAACDVVNNHLAYGTRTIGKALHRMMQPVGDILLSLQHYAKALCFHIVGSFFHPVLRLDEPVIILPDPSTSYLYPDPRSMLPSANRENFLPPGQAE